MLFPDGYDMSSRLNLDSLGIAYISIAAVWTLLLTIGSIFLVRHRGLHYIRIRNLPLSIASVATLHVYLVLCFLAYVLNGHFPCATEFWIMSIYLPLGIALFHAANTQLLHVAMLQKKFAPLKTEGQSSGPKSTLPAWTKVMNKIRAWGPTKRTMTLIGIGMGIQFLFAIIVFMISRKFHPGFGAIPWSDRPANDQQAAFQCRRGWEWWPSIAWQFAWSWIYAPCLLYKVRNIYDTHGWRMQTICCCIAGLPASPLWLMAVYLREMEEIDRRFVAPLWFAPSIILMQGFVIFVPCYQVYKNRRLEEDTRQIISDWEYRKVHGGSQSSGSTKRGSRASKLSSKNSSASIRNSNSPELYTLSSLQKCLQVNPKPLLLFAALKDFSGENISFLTHIQEWKANWAPSTPVKANVLRKNEAPCPVSGKLYRQQFNLAVRIYSSFVSLQYSDFPINISSVHLKQLDVLFADAAAKALPASAGSLCSPFGDFDIEKSPRVAVTGVGTPDNIMSSPESNHYNQVQGLQLIGSNDDLPDDIVIPAEFGPTSFDHAEASIRELVLTNTWPKFVNGGYAGGVDRIPLKERVNGMTASFGGSWSFVKERLTLSKHCRMSSNEDRSQESHTARSSSDEAHLV